MVCLMNAVKYFLLTYSLSVHFYICSIYCSFIYDYDTINYEPSIRIVRRAASLYFQPKKVMIRFQAFKKNFNLRLLDDYSVIHPNTELIVGGIVKRMDNVLPVRGFLENHQSSEVFGTLVDGIFRGIIKFDITNISNGAYYVEHSSYHFKNDPGFHSIIYHDSNVNISDSAFSHKMNPTQCGWSHPDIAHKMHLYSNNHGKPNDSHIHRHSRSKRSASSRSTQYVCNLYLQSDTFLWNKVMSLHHVKGQHHLAEQEISSIFTQHVQGAQAIYQNTEFQSFTGRGSSFHGIGFRVDRVRINKTEDCEAPLKDTNPFCAPNIDVTNFLNLNSYMKHDDFCLAYVFTYRDFNGGTLGLAWVAEPGGSGGVCEKNRLMQEAGSNVHKSLNTGIVTLLNYGSYVALKVSQLTFAHEMGHNFGSKHDDDHKEHGDCLPSFDDPRGNYIMFASATSGEKENNNKFSKCSKDSIARLLDRVTSSSNNCFRGQEGSFCGNKLTEEGEECDCGYTMADCNDRCCNPKMSKAHCKLKESVTIGSTSKKVLCSPSAGECCTNECQFESRSRMCRSRGECYQAAYCTGTATKCPPSQKSADLTRCQDNTRVCRTGECVGSVCESVPGWQECSIVRADHITADMMCFVACKQNTSHAPCISTFELQRNTKLRQKYQTLINSLMPSGRAIQLKAGAPCDNFRGYCDAFLRCRSVEAEGPLARIKGMLFSPLMLNKVKNWTTRFWWAVMLIIIASIVFVGIFIKVCSKSTPATDPKAPPRIRYKHYRHLHRRRRHSSRHRRHRSSRHRSEGVVNDALSPSDPQSRPSHTELPAPPLANVAPERRRRHRSRPISLVHSRSNHTEANTRPISMHGESNLEMHSIHNHNLPSYPPPAYDSTVVLPHQHGHGRGKKGHRHALDQQASRYH